MEDGSTFGDVVYDGTLADDPVESVDTPEIPAGQRELLAVIAWTVLADLLIFRTFGFTGPGLFFAMVPILMAVAKPGFHHRWCKLVAAMLVIVAIRLIWLGSGLTVFSGIVLTVGLAMSAAGVAPLVLEGIAMASRSIVDGASRLSRYRLPRRRSKTTTNDASADPAGAPVSESASGNQTSGTMSAWLAPIAAVLVFGSIFVFANPNLFTWVSGELNRWSIVMMDWLKGISMWEAPFCLLALFIGIGLMRPSLPLPHVGADGSNLLVPPGEASSPWYPAVRNTLLTLIGLFAVYLVFEFSTLWKREFPTGFYYAGYAHQGAAWLTFALALATALLSVAFSGSMLREPKLSRCRKFAWIWSGLNLLLALAVYNRLMIYVGYNGMTRMRTVGFFGITLVVIGFALVVYKIAKNRSFWWLIRGQLVAFVLTVIAYSVFPVDYIATRYNTSQVVSGYLPPSVMIAVKPSTDEGIFPLLDLIDTDDPIIREGVLAILAQRQKDLENNFSVHWTGKQGSHLLLRKRLDAMSAAWEKYSGDVDREDAITRFQDYAMQWY